ncbi:MAG TPA: prolyl oligopeptidase family serine peptidase [Candidatus Eisenbacteria bacterium]
MNSKRLALLLAVSLLAPRLAAAAVSSDPWLWLENVKGKRALAWVDRQDKECVATLTRSKEYTDLKTRLLDVLDSDARLPYVGRIGDRYYNFWRDAKHPRGLWRRTTLEEYRKDSPAWETVLDLDSLASSEKENWVWSGASTLPPDYRRCLISLSRGGADATVIREFDLTTKSFVPGGFDLPESKSEMTWIDKDRVFVSLATDSSTLTVSGYPRIVKEWKRGTPLSSAATVYEGRRQDVSVEAYHYFMPGFERDIVERDSSEITSQVFLRGAVGLVRIDKQDDAAVGLFRAWLLLRLRTDWTVGGKTYPAGALLAANLEDYLAGKRDLDVLYEPAARRSLEFYSPTRNAILIDELDDVKSRVYALRYENGRWNRIEIPGLPDLTTLSLTAVSSLQSDDYWLQSAGFLTPSTMALGTVGGGAPETLKRSPDFFDATREVVSQHEAVSKDGTRVPYFEVDPKDLKLDGEAPVLLTGYGGFEISMKPYYNPLSGRGWLERGGVYVLANLRGGGEFGPAWHKAAIRENRPRAYEDLIAVAEDLVRRKVTSPKHLGLSGGSNGGLLVGNVMTMRPDLFGAVHCASPLLDMVRYTKLSAGASWMDEYGDPDNPKDLRFLRIISPYHNVKKGANYPPVLFTSSMRDDRVHPGHARKMVAKMKAQGHRVFYYENVEGGHAGASNNEQRAFVSAMYYDFLWKELTGPTGRGAPRASTSR